MTETITVSSTETESSKAGEELGATIREGFGGEAADAVIVFASAQHGYESLLHALAESSGTEVIAGSSSAGEFTHLSRAEGSVSAIGLRSSTMRFAVGVGRGLSQNLPSAVQQALSGFTGLGPRSMPYRSALVMTDALGGYADAVVEELTVATGGEYRFFGGGAGDDGRFEKTHVFAGAEALTDAVVALELLSMEPVGVGVAHGWVPTGSGMRVTEADGMRLISLNGIPAVSAFEDHAELSGQNLDLDDPLPFFLHNVLGVKSNDEYRLRVPLSIGPDGSVTCAAVVPTGSVVHIMETTVDSAVLAAEQAMRSALDSIGDRRPAGALIFDCVATRLRLGHHFDTELNACAEMLHPAGFVGCNTYGQVARAEGQFSGFHNCTAVVCVLPE